MAEPYRRDLRHGFARQHGVARGVCAKVCAYRVKSSTSNRCLVRCSTEATNAVLVGHYVSSPVCHSDIRSITVETSRSTHLSRSAVVCRAHGVGKAYHEVFGGLTPNSCARAGHLCARPDWLYAARLPVGRLRPIAHLAGSDIRPMWATGPVGGPVAGAHRIFHGPDTTRVTLKVWSGARRRTPWHGPTMRTPGAHSGCCPPGCIAGFCNKLRMAVHGHTTGNRGPHAVDQKSTLLTSAELGSQHMRAGQGSWPRRRRIHAAAP